VETAGLEGRLQAALGSQYTIERELGRGGMATVFLAVDAKHHRRVAVKVLHPDLATSLGPERFRREIEVAAKLQHPHILSVHDSGETSTGLLWFTMPYVEGESLRDRLRRTKQLPLDDALRIARELAGALDYAHLRGVIHRDIKPENILLTTQGNALLADFGIARALAADLSPGGALTATGMSVGTPQYMSPEQASAERDLTPQTDIYSLGAVCFEMLAGEPPFTGATAQAVIAKMMTGEPPSVRHSRPSVPEPVDVAIRKALSPVAADRFASGADFARALEASPLPVTGRARAAGGPGGPGGPGAGPGGPGGAAGRPVVTHLRGRFMTPAIYRTLWERLSSRIVLVSESLVDEVSSRAEPKLRVIHNGARPPAPGFTPRPLPWLAGMRRRGFTVVSTFAP